MLFVFLLPQFILSPFSGAICDRFSRKAILSISCLIRVLTIGMLIVLLPKLSSNSIYLFAGILGLNAAFFYPAKMSAITNIVEKTQLKFANALTSSIGAIALLFGALIANHLNKFENHISFGIVACLYLFAAVLTSFLKFQFPQKYFKKEKSNDIKIAFNYLKKHKKAFYLVILSICLQFIVAVFSNSLNALITDY